MEINKEFIEALDQITKLLENHQIAIDTILNKLNLKGKVPNPKTSLNNDFNNLKFKQDIVRNV